MYNYIDYGLSTSMRHRQAPFKDWLNLHKNRIYWHATNPCWPLLQNLFFLGGGGSLDEYKMEKNENNKT